MANERSARAHVQKTAIVYGSAAAPEVEHAKPVSVSRADRPAVDIVQYSNPSSPATALYANVRRRSTPLPGLDAGLSPALIERQR